MCEKHKPQIKPEETLKTISLLMQEAFVLGR